MKTWLLLFFSSFLGSVSWAYGTGNDDCALPVAICQNYLATLSSTGNVTITPTNVDGGSTYDCGLLNMTVTPNTFNCADVGPNTVTLTVTDINGNTSACTATVTVADLTPPVALCQDITLSLDQNGEAAFTL